ncbi:unnamed protein product [Timema podura]|uniref:Uncharacterized protein n=1 Tax=Timema podura TaxID=61482 RepID=A0ABN7P791_TIMPD|nr:unnamed protein product [Timema podura]
MMKIMTIHTKMTEIREHVYITRRKLFDLNSVNDHSSESSSATVGDDHKNSDYNESDDETQSSKDSMETSKKYNSAELADQLEKLKPNYLNPLKINKKKLKDLKSLLPFIPPIHYDYFNGLVLTDEADYENDIEIIL